MLQPITYRGHVVACSSATRFFLSDELLNRPTGDPQRTFIMFMCAYAGDVLRGELAAPYSDLQARRYAQGALIPAELLERDQLNIAHTAAALGVPAEELEDAQQHAHRERYIATTTQHQPRGS